MNPSVSWSQFCGNDKQSSSLLPRNESLFIPLKYFIKRQESLAFIHDANKNNKNKSFLFSGWI